jgi:hypothetical protein
VTIPLTSAAIAIYEGEDRAAACSLVVLQVTFWCAKQIALEFAAPARLT